MNLPARTESGFIAVVLAAQRSRSGDPLEHRAGGGNKNFILLNGQPMLNWVVECLLHAPEVRRVVISMESPERLDELTGFEAARRAGRLVAVRSHDNLYSSLEAALSTTSGFSVPALVTSGDNPLLTPDMVRHFCGEVTARGLEAAIAMTPADVMRARYPDGQRRFYAFADGEYSNCNLYAITTARSVSAARIFQGGGQFRKNALRMLKAFGWINVLLYRLRRLRLADFGVRLSVAFGVPFGFVPMPFAEACIDVDNERTFVIAESILIERGSQAVTPATRAPATLQEHAAFSSPDYS